MTEVIKKNGEIYVNSLIADLLDSAHRQDWKRIDEEIVTQVSQLNDQDASQFSLDAGLLLSGMIHRDWEDPVSRDAIVTTLTAVNFSNHGVLEIVTKRMLDLIEHDPKKFPAGRAAMFLWKYRDNEELKNKIREGIEHFKKRKEIVEWKKDLLENIPGIEELLE